MATKNVCQDHYVSMILKDMTAKVGKTLDSKELAVYFQLLEHSREVAENTSQQEVDDRSKLVGLAAAMGISLHDELLATCLELVREYRISKL